MNQQKRTLADFIVLGTAQFGMDYGITNVSGRPSKPEAFRILEYAWERGIRRFDTAPGYDSEELLGDFIRTNGIERDVIVLTKISGLEGNESHRARISQSMDLSRRRLNSQIDTLFFHDPANSRLLLEDEIFFRELLETRQVNNIGVSVYDPVEVERLGTCELGLAFQFPLNVLDRRFENVEMTLGKRYARSIFLQGLLASPNALRAGTPRDILSLHKRYHDKLKSNGVSPVDFATSFVKNSNCVDYFLVGINTVIQLKKLLAIRFEGIWPNSLTAPLISRLPEKLIDPRTWGDRERQQLP